MGRHQKSFANVGYHAESKLKAEDGLSTIHGEQEVWHGKREIESKLTSD